MKIENIIYYEIVDECLWRSVGATQSITATVIKNYTRDIVWNIWISDEAFSTIDDFLLDVF